MWGEVGVWVGGFNGQIGAEMYPWVAGEWWVMVPVWKGEWKSAQTYWWFWNSVSSGSCPWQGGGVLEIRPYSGTETQLLQPLVSVFLKKGVTNDHRGAGTYPWFRRDWWWLLPLSTTLRRGGAEGGAEGGVKGVILHPFLRLLWSSVIWHCGVGHGIA